MGMFGGGGQAGGWSQGIGGQGGQQPHRRGADGWDEEYLGKVYDAEVVRRVFPYLKEYKIHAAISLVTMTIAAVLQFIQPLFIGQIVKQGIRGNEHGVLVFAGIMVGMAVGQVFCNMIQQLATAYLGVRILRKLQSEMYNHVQSLSLSFFDEMEVGRIISRLTSDVQVVQDLLTAGSLTALTDVLGISIVVVVLLATDWQLALVTFAIVPPLV